MIQGPVLTHIACDYRAEYLTVGHMCKSDANKHKLLAHPEFLPMLISGLLLEQDHPRLPLAEPTHQWCQTMHAECFMQLAVFPPGKAALLEHPEAIGALEALMEQGLTEDAKEFGRGSLFALRDTEQNRADGDGGALNQQHVMLSCKRRNNPRAPRAREGERERAKERGRERARARARERAA